MIAAIHQPNFMPWLGYFHKIVQVECMIFFDSVALSTGKSWTIRSRIRLINHEHWLSLPIQKSGRGGQRICDVRFQNFTYDWEKLITTVRHAYSRSPFFDEIYPFLCGMSKQDFEKLADFNAYFIESVVRNLGFQHIQFVRSSSKQELMETLLLKTDYIVQTCQSFGVSDYLSGKGGSLAFLEIEKFEKAGIRLDFQTFSHPIYPQHHNPNIFIRGLSILDALMQVGWAGTATLLKA
jgi:hypothetical protein